MCESECRRNCSNPRLLPPSANHRTESVSLWPIAGQCYTCSLPRPKCPWRVLDCQNVWMLEYHQMSDVRSWWLVTAEGAITISDLRQLGHTDNWNWMKESNIVHTTLSYKTWSDVRRTIVLSCKLRYDTCVMKLFKGLTAYVDSLYSTYLVVQIRLIFFLKASLILKLIYRVNHILIRSENFWTFNVKGPL